MDMMCRAAKELLEKNGYAVFTVLQQDPLRVYRDDDGSAKKLGLVVDFETTGLNVVTSCPLEIGLVLFEYAPDTGRIYRILDTYTAFEDPGCELSDNIKTITNITEEMVVGKRFDDKRVEELAEKAHVVISHVAKFDRMVGEKRFPVFAAKPWVCSHSQVDWEAEGATNRNLKSLAIDFQFVMQEHHRAISDTYTLVHILAQDLAKAGEPVLANLLRNGRKKEYRVWAIDSPYGKKELLKERGYDWNNGENGLPRAWSRCVAEDEAGREEDFLRDFVYGGKEKAKKTLITPYTRFSHREFGGAGVEEKGRLLRQDQRWGA